MLNVNLKFTGLVRKRMGVNQMEYAFDGSSLAELLEAFFNRYDIQDLILDENGEILPYSRIVVNGRFSYLVGNMETPIQDGDLVVFIRPYVVAF